MVNAKEFSEEWISAWNSRQIDRIMNHYAEEIVFYSPVIQNLGVNQEGILRNKTALRSYFEKGLAQYPDLFFDLHDVLVGTNSVVLYYSSINNKKSAEFMQFDEKGKINFVSAHYNK